jgi:hypothetical protein
MYLNRKISVARCAERLIIYLLVFESEFSGASLAKSEIYIIGTCQLQYILYLNTVPFLSLGSSKAMLYLVWLKKVSMIN